MERPLHISSGQRLIDALAPIARAAEVWGVDRQFKNLPDEGPICLPLTLGEARAALRAWKDAHG